MSGELNGEVAGLGKKMCSNGGMVGQVAGVEELAGNLLLG
uniref:Uncharacterized protein n=1 Tax=Arundo donax TaxID=35708 RepID=A0A0A8ZJW8_ARUDO